MRLIKHNRVTFVNHRVHLAKRRQHFAAIALYEADALS